jgi:hypothetical protein
MKFAFSLRLRISNKHRSVTTTIVMSSNLMKNIQTILNNFCTVKNEIIHEIFLYHILCVFKD